MASALEIFVNNIRTLSMQGNYRELCELLNQSSELLVKNGAHLDNVLETLDHQNHSLGVMAVLTTKLSLAAANGSPEQQELLFSQVQEFVNNCNGEQVRFAPDTFAELCHLVTISLSELRVPLRGIQLLRRAIRKVQLRDAQLTALHADLMQLCLLSRCLPPALEFLDSDVTTLSRDGLDARHFLLYYYYGGMVYAALKNFERALYFFEVAVTTPAMAVSHVMLEAYKKYILVSLLLHGKVQPVPKYTSQVVSRFIKPLSQAYVELAAAYASSDGSALRVCATRHAEAFARDSNVGLVKQVLASQRRKSVQRLTKTFLTLSLSDVASRVELDGPADAEKHILSMIEDGEIFATINQKDGMVIFHDDPETYNSPAMLRLLEEEMAVCADLDRRMLAMEEEIVVNPQFVKKALGHGQEDEAATKVSTYSM